MGKAGGLVGKRTNILIRQKIIYDKTNDVTNIDIGDFDTEKLHHMINIDSQEYNKQINIHIGPMLTVSGTILQNDLLLLYYKYVWGCIGLEMEGYFFAKEIEIAIKNIPKINKFQTRFFYYISDLPLDPNQNLVLKMI